MLKISVVIFFYLRQIFIFNFICILITIFKSSGLNWLRGTIEVHDEMEEMRSEYEAAKLVSKVTMKELFVNPTLRSPLIICLVIMIAQQLSGINAVSCVTFFPSNKNNLKFCACAGGVFLDKDFQNGPAKR